MGIKNATTENTENFDARMRAKIKISATSAYSAVKIGGKMDCYRPCKYRKSLFGIFQCDKHNFQNTTQETYDGLHEFCKKALPEKYCPHLDFGFSMHDGVSININCTHTFKSRHLENFEECKKCDYPDKEGVSIN